MTVAGNDDPEINLGAEPSAPPLAATASAIPVASALHSLPVATPLGPPAPPAAAAQSSAASHGNSTIEKTANPDGSLSVKVTTTNTLPNGLREVTIEYFQIPTHMASSVSAGIDAGEPPSGLYLTKMEQQTLPPGTSQVPSSANPRPTTAYPMAGNAAPVQQPANHHPFEQPGDRRRRNVAAAICISIVGIAILLAIGANGLNSNSNASSPSGYFPTPPSPTPWSPNPYPWSSPSSPSRPTAWNPAPWPWEVTTSPTISSGPTLSPRPTSSPTTSPPPTTSVRPTGFFDSTMHHFDHKSNFVGRGECTNAQGKTYDSKSSYSFGQDSHITCSVWCDAENNWNKVVGFQFRRNVECNCLFDRGNLLGPITGSTGIGDTECYELRGWKSAPSAAA
mmetsp:Transcript_35544/g.81281  ORF Transcript_35544/g.81281 Transcript_35544/m.81281 type:complete len:393 (-) Transcript_35544:141-1319(-)